MGSFRFSDVGRNLIVASTDMIGLSKKSVLNQRGSKYVRSQHYSETEFASDVYGHKGVYEDNLVVNEIVQFEIVRVRA